MLTSISARTSVVRYAQLDDSTLLQLTRDGDSRAYGELWERHSGVGVAIARRVTTRIDSSDVVSEAFARMLQAIRNGSGPRTAVRSYLATTIRSICATWGRAQQETVGLDQAPEVGYIDERLSRIDGLGDAGEVFRSLPQRWQTALWHSAVEGLSNAEVAEIMGMNVSALAMLTSRARAGLRTAWETREAA